MARPQESDAEARVRALHHARERVASELSKVIVGQRQVAEELMISLFSGGHCLLVGVPGLAKTLTIRTLASTLSLDFARIQFTPDLMPADITGTEVMQEDRATGHRSFQFVRGPIFANVVLADEINRTPPKTQAALLEAMEERQVTAAGRQHPLPTPFFVLATQNPIEQEGTYPLPEAQLDRFMFQVQVGYPSEEEELQIVQSISAERPQVEVVLTGEQILEFVDVVRSIPVAEHVARYALRLSRSTRRGEPHTPDFINEWVLWGAGPRASQHLVLAAKARAALNGRCLATCEDIRAVAAPALRHRLKTNFRADAEGVSVDDIVRRLIEETSETAEDPKSRGAQHGESGNAAVFRSSESG